MSLKTEQEISGGLSSHMSIIESRVLENHEPKPELEIPGNIEYESWNERLNAFEESLKLGLSYGYFSLQAEQLSETTNAQTREALETQLTVAPAADTQIAASTFFPPTLFERSTIEQTVVFQLDEQGEDEDSRIREERETTRSLHYATDALVDTPEGRADFLAHKAATYVYGTYRFAKDTIDLDIALRGTVNIGVQLAVALQERLDPYYHEESNQMVFNWVNKTVAVMQHMGAADASPHRAMNPTSSRESELQRMYSYELTQINLQNQRS